MTGQPKVVPTIPRETLRSAKAVFGSGNFYIQVGDHLKTILDEIRLDYFSEEIKNSLSGRVILPLVTYFEFIEGLTDFQAADALRTRIDWKYALHLPMHPPILHPTALCEFRRMIIIDSKNQREFQKLVNRLTEFNPPMNKHSKIIKVMPILSEVCSINRLTRIRQAMYEALGAVASKSPEWLRQVTLPHWYGRFGNLSSESNLPVSMNQQELIIQKLGMDIQHLLEEVHQSNIDELSDIHEIRILQQIWELQYEKSSPELPGLKETSMQLSCDACINLTM